MSRKTLAACVLAVAVALGPAVLVVALAKLDPYAARRWVWWFFALAVAMLGIVYGGDWETWWRRRRAARRSRLRVTVRHVRPGQPP
ncbi:MULTISPECIES: hypothetical protein [unclassified Kitasatospora]|uniref:hypothetical protein n=1 Tax=unclassified Kitasatospora TaxID=2633591 RepID=UPI000DB959D1|nr:hypothetical protein [Kitasatospora sp. SolWspMP-SS2h]RAJ47103.1 hypothetical protein K353_00304 [Kitasatospora sp. SolWspMP-SS2h]